MKSEEMRERERFFYDNETGKEMVKPDMVNHPAHYTQGGIETLDFILAKTKKLPGDEAVLVGHIVRYSTRYRDKFNPLEDLKKAEFYLKRLIKLVEVQE